MSLLLTHEPEDVYASTDASGNPRGAVLGEAQVLTVEIVAAIEAAIATSVAFKGGWDASAGTFPGSGSATKGDGWRVTTAGTVDSKVFRVGDLVIALVDSASTGTYAANWVRVASALDPVVRGTDSGAGTANAIQVVTSRPVSADGGQLVAFNAFESNTSTTVTITVTDSTGVTIGPLAVKTAGGAGPDVGALEENSSLTGEIVGSTFRLISGLPGAPGSSDVVGTSTTSRAIGTGSKTFTVAETDRGWAVGARLRASSDADGANFMEGVVTAYSGTTLTINVDLKGGSGTKADWTINLAGQPGVVQSIVAGSGVTVDDTDPANPVVAAAGDVSGPGSSMAGALAAFDGTTGKSIKQSGMVDNGSTAITVTRDTFLVQSTTEDSASHSKPNIVGRCRDKVTPDGAGFHISGQSYSDANNLRDAGAINIGLIDATDTNEQGDIDFGTYADGVGGTKIAIRGDHKALHPATNNSWDTGYSSARWRTGYFATSVDIATAQPKLQIVGTQTASIVMQDSNATTGKQAMKLIVDGGICSLVNMSDALADVSTHSRFYMTGGMTIGNPTGGDKGAGTLNATAVYDDNAVLSCFVFDQALDGRIDDAKWDAKVPDRVAERRMVKRQKLEKKTRKIVTHEIVDGRAIEREIEEEYDAPAVQKVPVYDGAGEPVMEVRHPEIHDIVKGKAVVTPAVMQHKHVEVPIFEEVEETTGVDEPRRHDGMRKFRARIGTDTDPLDIDAYTKHWREKRHLTSMPNEAKHGHNSLSSGEWIQRLVETVEIQATHIAQLNDRLKVLEKAGRRR